MSESIITHRIEINTRIAEACEDGSHRYATDYLQVTPAADGESCWIAGTDTRILAIVKAPGQVPTPAMMPAKIVPNVTSRKSGTVSLNGRWENSKGQFADIGEPGRFPRVADVLPDLTVPNHLVVSLDAELLRNLARALNDSDSKAITLFLPLPTESEVKENGMQVVDAIPVLGAQGIGVIMPCYAAERHAGSTGVNSRIADYQRTRDEFAAARKPIDHPETV